MKMQKIFVAGHNGMVGSAIVRKLKQKNFEIITIDRSDLDLINQKEATFFIAIRGDFMLECSDKPIVKTCAYISIKDMGSSWEGFVSRS